MSHEIPKVAARKRDRTGSRYANRLRSSGEMPAIMYGHGAAPTSISVNAKEILTHLHHGSHVVELDLDGATETCLVKDLQFGYLGDNVIHIDFARVNLQEEVTVQVQLSFRGTPDEGKQAGAIIRHDQPELTVTCKVIAIPDEIVVDLSKMDGSNMTAGEVVMPEGVALAADPSSVIASVSIMRQEEAEGEEAGVEGAGGSEPEVITEAKSEDG